MRYSLLSLALLVASGLTSTTFAQGPYTGAQAGIDSYNYNEAQRRAGFDRQLYANYAMDYLRTAPPLGVDVYVQTRRGLFGRRRSRVYVQPRAVSPRLQATPGMIGSYPYRAPQSVGRVEYQSAPNRWESHPVYQQPVPAPRRNLNVSERYPNDIDLNELDRDDLDRADQPRRAPVETLPPPEQEDFPPRDSGPRDF
jgi:hypothetical protein